MATWIPLLVPEEDYLEVAALVAFKQEVRASDGLGRRPAAPPALFVVAPTPVDLGTDAARRALAELRTWNRDDLRRLSRGETATTERWARAMDHCADNVGRFFATADLAVAAGMRVEEWRDAQRKLGKHLRGHYPMARGRWPLASYEDGQVHVGITPEQAELWRRVRAERGW